MTDESIDQLNNLVVRYGLYSIYLNVPKKVAIYGPGKADEVIYVRYSELIDPDWQDIENTLVKYTLLNGF